MKGNTMKTRYSCISFYTAVCQKYFPVLLFLLLMSGVLLTFSRAALSQDISSELKVEHRVVSIQENAGLVPTTVIIKRGTTVIWLNYSSEPNVIKFQNKKVTTACRSPINFFLADNGSYQSIPLRIGAVASLCFIEKGTFEYKIRPPNPQWNDPEPLRGTIRVD